MTFAHVLNVMNTFSYQWNASNNDLYAKVKNSINKVKP